MPIEASPWEGVPAGAKASSWGGKEGMPSACAPAKISSPGKGRAGLADGVSPACMPCSAIPRPFERSSGSFSGAAGCFAALCALCSGDFARRAGLRASSRAAAEGPVLEWASSCGKAAGAVSALSFPPATCKAAGRGGVSPKAGFPAGRAVRMSLASRSGAPMFPARSGAAAVMFQVPPSPARGARSLSPRSCACASSAIAKAREGSFCPSSVDVTCSVSRKASSCGGVLSVNRPASALASGCCVSGAIAPCGTTLRMSRAAVCNRSTAGRKAPSPP